MDSENPSLTVPKIIAASGLFGVSVLCGVVPFKLAKMFKWNEPNDRSKKQKSTTKVNILLCFGCGVLIATTFLHLLPDIKKTQAMLIEEGLMAEMRKLHLPELLMVLGFFMIYLIEEIVHMFLHRHQNKMNKEKEKAGNTSKEKSSFEDGLIHQINERSRVLIKYFIKTRSDDKVELLTNSLEASEKCQAAPEVNSHGHGHSHVVPMPQSGEEDVFVTSMRGLLIVLALSIHELFEGFALGLQNTTKGVYFMFAAVAAHKYVISFCIGVELMIQRTKLWLAFTYVMVYSFVSALGIVVGILLTSGDNGDNLQVPNFILQGLATGTLIYVIFFEILSKDVSGIIPFTSVFVGFIGMFGLQYIASIIELRGNQAATSLELL